jgi:hypothetical protein
LWQVHDQELGAVVQSFIEWSAWLIDTQQPVEVMSNHSNLKYFMTSKTLSNFPTCWTAFLSSFDFVIKHVLGKLNPADPATCCPDFIPSGENPNTKQVLLEESGNVLKLRGSLLDEPNPQLEIWAVLSSSSPVFTPQKDTDVFFCPPTKELRFLLLTAYAAKPPSPQPNKDLSQQEGLWWRRGRVFVLLCLQPRVLQEFHDGTLGRHLGSLKTLEVIGCTLTWPRIWKDVLNYTKSCFSCQRAKHSNQKPPGLRHSLQVPNRLWSCIGIDFVVKLPLLDGFDSILVILNHFLKGIHLIAASESWTTEEFVCSFFD